MGRSLRQMCPVKGEWADRLQGSSHMCIMDAERGAAVEKRNRASRPIHSGDTGTLVIVTVGPLGMGEELTTVFPGVKR